MCGTPTTLPLADVSSSGCACCSPQESQTTRAATAEAVFTTDFAVTGLTCGSCASRVSTAVGSLDSVTGVQLDLVAGGTSTLRVNSDTTLRDAEVVSAVERAGYHVVSRVAS